MHVPWQTPHGPSRQKENGHWGSGNDQWFSREVGFARHRSGVERRGVMAAPGATGGRREGTAGGSRPGAAAALEDDARLQLQAALGDQASVNGLPANVGARVCSSSKLNRRYVHEISVCQRHRRACVSTGSADACGMGMLEWMVAGTAPSGACVP